MHTTSIAPAGLALALLSAMLTAILSAGNFQTVYGDGLTMESLPPATVGDRQASLFVRINPPILTSESQQDAFMQFRLFDARNNETVKFTTFLISVTKGTDRNAKPILTDVFHTESGLLTLKITPQEGQLNIYGTREDFLQAWKADPGGTINIRGPLLLEGGLYHFQIEVFGIDNIRNIFSPDNAPRFDSWLSVGDIASKDIEYNNQNYNVTIISYYDKVKNINFDSNKKMVTWSMPFDWNVERIGENNIFVHEEIKIPRTLEGLGDTTNFAATVNGAPIEGRMISVDPYSSENEMILHYLLNKNDILKMAESVPQGKNDMTFTLASAANAEQQTTGEIVTDTGGLQVNLEWTPNPLSADDMSTVKLAFFDAFSGQRIDSDVLYDLRVLDEGGNEVYSKQDLTAKSGTDIQTIDFPSDEKYSIEIAVSGLTKDGQPVDQTRNGIARGIVIVPEFPVAFMAAGMVMATGIILTLISKSSIRNRFQ